MADAASPLPMTEAEVAHLEGVVKKLERLVALTRCGPGGVSQLRRIFLSDLAEIKRELSLRPRISSFKKFSTELPQ